LPVLDFVSLLLLGPRNGPHALRRLQIMATVSTTQTYKAAEPVFVVLAMRLLAPKLFQAQVTKHVFVWLLVIVFGVALGTYAPPMSMVAMGSAACSNTFFATSTVSLKLEEDGRLLWHFVLMMRG
jgi:beta-lactamase regulating signal transducer with metallopeptidase domain